MNNTNKNSTNQKMAQLNLFGNVKAVILKKIIYQCTHVCFFCVNICRVCLVPMGARRGVSSSGVTAGENCLTQALVPGEAGRILNC